MHDHRQLHEHIHHPVGFDPHVPARDTLLETKRAAQNITHQRPPTRDLYHHASRHTCARVLLLYPPLGRRNAGAGAGQLLPPDAGGRQPIQPQA